MRTRHGENTVQTFDEEHLEMCCFVTDHKIHISVGVKLRKKANNFDMCFLLRIWQFSLALRKLFSRLRLAEFYLVVVFRIITSLITLLLTLSRSFIPPMIICYDNR